jgi:3-methylcrotonyl-CoA carboxylase alpha subunit
VFEALLIANRGEIACRVIRTARALGLRTVAVYSEADREALHVELAHEAHCIGPPRARESYLCAERILEAARRSRAEAIHPGYGFLSENADFAEACAGAGLAFVGPPPEAIRAMGQKGAAKERMLAAGVPVVPGYHGADQSDAALARAAGEVGYPVVIKAVAGGGGRGLRRADAPEEFAAALASARREAEAAFGDARVIVEKWLARPRHIEFQVFADSQGNAVHLFERDCSLQRRHQKVVEEAPAPGLAAPLRARMGTAAVQATKAIGYEGAGTVEFILDASRGLEDAPFYFMEMNTRLQVEHPVTECVAGVDLVEWQLRVAAGEPLPLRQEELRLRGHAVEARLYAEDPARGFLPAAGVLLRFRAPEGEGIRVDAGVREGDAVSVHYDPLLAKLVAHGRDRPEALRRLRAALAATRVAGVSTNLGFLCRALAHPVFAAGGIDTGFLERHRDELLPAAPPAPDRALALAALGLLLARSSQGARDPADPHSPWDRADGFRLGGRAREELRLVDGRREVEVGVERVGEGFRLDLPGGPLEARALSRGGELVATLGGARVEATFARRGEELWVAAAGDAWRLRLSDPIARAEAGAEEAGGEWIAAPLPGRLIRVEVSPGEQVRRGQVLVVLEAMKMEHALAAPRDGTVESLGAALGDQVAEGAILVRLRERAAR